MKVVKFGGSSLASAAQVRKVCDIVTADPERKIVVVSAPGKRDNADTKVTDLLIATAKARLSGLAGVEEMARVLARFDAMAGELGLPAASTAAIARNLHACLAADTSDPGRYLDTLKAAGEDNCARLVAEYLRAQGVDAQYVNPRDGGLVLSDEPGNARVLQESYPRLAALRALPGIIVFPGFFGYSQAGQVVTFPRGGSDITGAILAKAVSADVYENFTDVDSVFAANPTIVDAPVAVSEITYREMRELAYAGFSVFHEEALEPVVHAGIPVAIKNTNNPAAPGTRLVHAREATGAPVVGIAASAGFCMVYISKYMMNREVGFVRRLLQLFEEDGVAFEHMPSGIDNVSIIVHEDEFTPAVEADILKKVRMQLQPDDISVERGLALVMVVGEGMRHAVGLASRATRAFAHAGINLEMINQGSSEVSMMFGIATPDLPDAVRALYHEFFTVEAVHA